MHVAKDFTRMLKLAGKSWMKHDATRIGAALAYYTLLSLAPLVLLSIAVGGFFFGNEATVSHLVDQVRQVAGGDAATLVGSLAKEANKPSSGWLASIIGMFTILLGASGVFAELRSALNLMWDIAPDDGEGWLSMVKARLLSVGIVLGIGFLLVVSLVASASLAAVGKYFSGFIPVPAHVLELLNLVISFIGIAFLFALVLRYVPDVRVEWRYLWVGAAISALFFTAGKALIGLYLGRAAVGSVYGAGGSVVVVTVWTYYSAQIFLFGAEFTWVYSHRDIKRQVKEQGRAQADNTGPQPQLQR